MHEVQLPDLGSYVVVEITAQRLALEMRPKVPCHLASTVTAFPTVVVQFFFTTRALLCTRQVDD